MPDAPAWPLESVRRIYRQPLLELIEQAHAVHRQAHPRPEVQLCRLLSIKTGGCPEDCAYCPQSARYHTGVEAEKLLEPAVVLATAQQAREAGATRFCMGAAWRHVKDGPEFDRVLEMVSGVGALGLEVCCTLGMLTKSQAERLAGAGLTAYNHNLDTSPEFYGEIITTRGFQERLDTLDHVRQAGISVCCGGILGMGESEEDRLRLLQILASQQPPPDSVPINALVPVPGTPLAAQPPISAFEFVRAIATARVLMPAAKVRLSAGRLELSPEAQALCFYAGANSIFMGDKLLTTANPEWSDDRALLTSLGLEPEPQLPPSRLRTLPADGRRPASGDDISPLQALEADLTAELEGLAARSRRRQLRPPFGEDFCSNDYLGLAAHPGIREQMERALRDGLPLGSTASRLVRGDHPVIGDLEREFADLRGADAALLFSSGYAANLALLGALIRPGDIVFSDRSNHASLIDGLRLTGARRHVLPHLDLDAWDEAMRRNPAGRDQRRFLVVESVYSMDGDRAPLGRLAELCRSQRVLLIVDEAHATGLFGPDGGGSVAELSEEAGGPHSPVVATIHPCGKALGASGALVACSRSVRDILINRGRSLVFSTAPAPLLAVQLRAALRVIADEPERRQLVFALARRLRAALPPEFAFPAGANEDDRVPIVPVVLGADAVAVQVGAALHASGLDVRAIRPPTVPEGTARLRITVHAGQDPAAVDRLAAAVGRAVRSALPERHVPEPVAVAVPAAR